jgi:sugar phosphate isomerase/epimerase
MFKNLNPVWLGVSGHQSEVIELALTYGFSSLDLNVNEFAVQVRSKGMAYAGRLIQSARLKVGTFSLPFDVDADDEIFKEDLKKLPELAGYAAELGCRCCTTELAPAGEKLPYHENFEFHRRRLSEICSALLPSGVRLAVGFQAAEYLRQNKTFQFIHDLDSLMMLLGMAAAPNLGLLLDIWNLVASGGSVESLQKLSAGQILAVQLADMPADVELAKLDNKSRLLPSLEGGRIDFAAYFAALRTLGYDGPVTVKPSRGALPRGRRDLAVKQTAEVLKQLGC